MNRNEMAASLVLVFSLVTGCGGLGSASAPVGASGGSISLGSALTLSVPAGAVDDGTVITVREVEPLHGEREFELEPRGLELKVPAELSVEASQAMRLNERENEVEHGLELQGFDDRRMHAKLRRLGHVVMRRHDDVDGGDDHGSGGHGADDGDAGTPTGGTGAACVDDDTCACGSECVVGRCTAVVTCTNSAQCSAGESCRAATKHGQTCGVTACHP